MNRHIVEHVKQKLNRVTHAKKAYNNAQRTANALKRQYHKAAFLVLYNKNQPHRNGLTQQEVAAIRNMKRNARRSFMVNRVLGKTVLPNNIRRRIMNNVL
jgi:hypothetical protein